MCECVSVCVYMGIGEGKGGGEEEGGGGGEGRGEGRGNSDVKMMERTVDATEHEDRTFIKRLRMRLKIEIAATSNQQRRGLYLIVCRRGRD